MRMRARGVAACAVPSHAHNNLVRALEAAKMAERETKSVKLSQLSLQQMDRFKGQLNDVSKLHVMSVNNPLRQKIVLIINIIATLF